MDNYEPGLYTERVLEAIRLLNDRVMPNFCQKVETAANDSDQETYNNIDENEFIDATRLVYEGVREIRRAVLLNRGFDEYANSDEEWENDEVAASEIASQRPESTTAEMVDEYPEVQGISNAREAMKKLPEEDRQ